MFLTFQLPAFPLQAVRRWRDEAPPNQPIAVMDPAVPRHPIMAANAAAHRAGVQPGQPATRALARCEGLVLLPRAVIQEEAASQILLETAALLSPDVELTAPGVVTADLTRVRLADPEAAALKSLTTLRGCRLEARAGLAPNPDLALLASRRARPFLAVREPSVFLRDIPLRALDAPHGLLQLLASWGVRTAGQLTAIAFPEIAERLGPDGARLWQRAAGTGSRLLDRVRPRPIYRESLDFEHPVATLEPILFVLRRFLDQLTVRLKAAWRPATGMTLTILTEDGPSAVREFALPSPSADPDLLFRILHTHLEGLRLDHCPSGLALELHAGTAAASQFQLFESALRDPNRFGETMARLMALTGPDRTGVPVPADSHHPDRWTLAAPQFHRTPAPDADRTPDISTGPPLRRFRPPVPATVRTAGHRPAHLDSAVARGRIADSRGPWRLSGHWWEAEPAWRREEWDVALGDGSLWRIRREDDAWFVDGCLDHRTGTAAS